MPTAPHARGAAEPTLSPDRPGCEGRHPLLCRRLSSGCGGRRGSRDLARPTPGWGECWASPLGAQDEQPGWPRVCSDQRWPREDSQRGEGSRPRPGGGGRTQTRGWGGCRKPHGLGWRGPARVTGLRGDGTSPRGDAPAPAFTFQATFIRCVVHPGPGQRARGLHGRCGPGPHSRGRPGVAGSDVVTCSLAPLRLPRGGRGLR